MTCSFSSPRLAVSGAGKNCEVISCRGIFLRFDGEVLALPLPFTLDVLVGTVFSGPLDVGAFVAPKTLLALRVWERVVRVTDLPSFSFSLSQPWCWPVMVEFEAFAASH